MNQVLSVKADWVVNEEGVLRRNEEAVAVGKAFDEVTKFVNLVDAAWCGALIANIFKARPWLQSFQLDLDVSSEFGDEGQAYRSVSACVLNITAVEGQVLSEELTSEGVFDADAANQELVAIFDEEHEEIYASLMPPWEYSDLRLKFDRGAVADLLSVCPISGQEAFVRLFPEYRTQVTDVTDRDRF